jgi:serine/threonine protein kinase
MSQICNHHRSFSSGGALKNNTQSNSCLSADKKKFKDCSNLILNRYRILKTIGKGTFGKVQLCEDTLTDNLKVYPSFIFSRTSHYIILSNM